VPVAKQLKIASIQDRLSQIKMCMVQGGLPPLQWPDHTRRFLRAESTVRRTSRTYAPSVKAPFMPSLAIALDAFLRRRTGSVIDPKLETASAAVLLSYVFGWRASTTNVLR
jgi:hypothetical protein